MLRGRPTSTTNGGPATHIMTWHCLKPQVVCRYVAMALRMIVVTRT